MVGPSSCFPTSGTSRRHNSAENAALFRQAKQLLCTVLMEREVTSTGPATATGPRPPPRSQSAASSAAARLAGAEEAAADRSTVVAQTMAHVPSDAPLASALTSQQHDWDHLTALSTWETRKADNAGLISNVLLALIAVVALIGPLAATRSKRQEEASGDVSLAEVSPAAEVIPLLAFWRWRRRVPASEDCPSDRSVGCSPPEECDDPVVTVESAQRPDVVELAARTRAFVREVVLPLDDEYDGDITAAGGDRARLRLQAAARDAGVFAPHVPNEFGGHGLGMVERAPVFEEAGYSLFGPLALAVAAPDEGNAHLLAEVATPAQKEQFLGPLARGEVRSAFAMTEPAPGAGSDPAALVTRAERVEGGWSVSGRKWFITGADGAAFLIVMARTSGEPGGSGGATMFLVPGDAPGLSVGRHLDTVDRSMVGGHCEVTFADVVVPQDNVLGAVDEGFRYAQVRLGPARMTHVMRWLGAARRAHEVAVKHVAGRQVFGSRLADLGMVQQRIADNEIDLAATRALMLKACADLDAGDRAAAHSTSIAKTFAGEALFRVADRSMQICGGVGVSTELPVAKIHRELRPFQIYDGASEVHRWSIARRAVRQITGGRV